MQGLQEVIDMKWVGGCCIEFLQMTLSLGTGFCSTVHAFSVLEKDCWTELCQHQHLSLGQKFPNTLCHGQKKLGNLARGHDASHHPAGPIQDEENISSPSQLFLTSLHSFIDTTHQPSGKPGLLQSQLQECLPPWPSSWSAGLQPEGPQGGCSWEVLSEAEEQTRAGEAVILPSQAGAQP